MYEQDNLACPAILLGIEASGTVEEWTTRSRENWSWKSLHGESTLVEFMEYVVGRTESMYL